MMACFIGEFSPSLGRVCARDVQRTHCTSPASDDGHGPRMRRQCFPFLLRVGAVDQGVLRDRVDPIDGQKKMFKSGVCPAPGTERRN